MQLIALLMTVCVAITGGTIAGYIMKLRWLDEPPAGLLYTDEAFWEPKAGKVHWSTMVPGVLAHCIFL